MAMRHGIRLARGLTRPFLGLPCHTRLTLLSCVRACQHEPRRLTRLPYIPLRANSTTTTPKSDQKTAHEKAERMMDRYRKKAIRRSQILDANQLQKLHITLGRPHLIADGAVQDMTEAPPDQGTVIPPCYHLVYFTPSDLESDLGPDGTDQPFAPGPPFTRRMWAGGRVRWNPDNPLRVGDRVTETTKLLHVFPKTSKHGGNTMLMATVEKVFSTEKGLAVREARTWVFLEPPALETPTTSKSKEPRQQHLDTNPPVSRSQFERDSSSPFPRQRLQWSEKALFRFSALTFNAHMIHVNPDWCRGVEGLPGLVVHGPLNLINMMDYWRYVHDQNGKLQPLEVSYRAIAPLFVREKSLMSTVSVGEVDDHDWRIGKSTYKIRLSKRKNEGSHSFDPENLTTVMEGAIRVVQH
ncbi:mesaconyl-C4 hydratase [Naviculisporaceae sp. PSN 640]